MTCLLIIFLVEQIRKNNTFLIRKTPRVSSETRGVFYLQFTIYYLLLIAACAAANLAIGTRNGEQDT